MGFRCWSVRGGTAALCCVGLVSCTSAHHQATERASVPPTSLQSPPSRQSPLTTTPSWPTVVTATPYSYDNPAVGPQLSFGTAIPTSDIGARSNQVGNVTYALADQGDLLSVTYPAISHDAGRTWAIDGPILHITAANGAYAVGTITALSATAAYAWGGGGNFVRSTTDGGQHWWGALFDDSVDRASDRNGVLTAVIYTQNGNDPTYSSTDGGRTWRLQATPST